MPGKTSSRMKRAPRRRRRTRRKKQSIPLPIGGFSNSKIVKLRWAQPFTLDAPDKSYVIQSFIANSPSVVYLGGSQSVPVANSHQASNFDVWSERYNSHVVLGSKITIRYTPYTNASVVPGYVGCWVGEGNDSQDDLKKLLDKGIGAVFEQKANKKMHQMGAGTSSRPYTFNTYFSPSKTFGVSKQAINNDTAYHGSTPIKNAQGTIENSARLNSLPNELAYFNLFVSSINDNNPGLMVFMITIDWVVRFYGLEEQLSSAH